MPTRFQQRFNAHAVPVMNREFQTQVQLRNGGNSSELFTAIYRTQMVESIEFETGLNVKIKHRIYLLPKASCLISDVAVVPSTGMFIIDDSVEREILPLAGIPSVELLPGGYRYLVRTKEITDG